MRERKRDREGEIERETERERERVKEEIVIEKNERYSNRERETEIYSDREREETYISFWSGCSFDSATFSARLPVIIGAEPGFFFDRVANAFPTRFSACSRLNIGFACFLPCALISERRKVSWSLYKVSAYSSLLSLVSRSWRTRSIVFLISL